MTTDHANVVTDAIDFVEIEFASLIVNELPSRTTVRAFGNDCTVPVAICMNYARVQPSRRVANTIERTNVQSTHVGITIHCAEPITPQLRRLNEPIRVSNM